MARQSRRLVAVNVETGERREFGSAYECAIALRAGHAAVLAALDRNGTCCGWKMYDTPETLRKRIDELREQLEEIER